MVSPYLRREMRSEAQATADLRPPCCPRCRAMNHQHREGDAMRCTVCMCLYAPKGRIATTQGERDG